MTERQHVRVIAIIWEIEEWGGWREKDRETACESDSYYMGDRGMRGWREKGVLVRGKKKEK